MKRVTMILLLFLWAIVDVTSVAGVDVPPPPPLPEFVCGCQRLPIPSPPVASEAPSEDESLPLKPMADPISTEELSSKGPCPPCGRYPNGDPIEKCPDGLPCGECPCECKDANGNVIARYCHKSQSTCPNAVSPCKECDHVAPFNGDRDSCYACDKKEPFDEKPDSCFDCDNNPNDNDDHFNACSDPIPTYPVHSGGPSVTVNCYPTTSSSMPWINITLNPSYGRTPGEFIPDVVFGTYYNQRNCRQIICYKAYLAIIVMKTSIQLDRSFIESSLYTMHGVYGHEQRHVDGYNLAAELLGEEAMAYLESAPCYTFHWNGSWQNSPEAHEAYIKAEAYSEEIKAELIETYESYLDLMILHQWPIDNPIPLAVTEYFPIGNMPERATNE